MWTMESSRLKGSADRIAHLCMCGLSDCGLAILDQKFKNWGASSFQQMKRRNLSEYFVPSFDCVEVSVVNETKQLRYTIF